MRLRLLIAASVLLLTGASALAQTDRFEDTPPPPAGYGGEGQLVQACSEKDLVAAQRECQSKIGQFENTIRDFERRKARKDTDATAKQLQWLRDLQHKLSQYRDACARIDYNLQQVRAHPETRCDAIGGERQVGK